MNCHLNALYIFRSTLFPVFLRQPQANRLPAKRFHAGQNAPDIAADLLTIAPVFLRRLSALDNDLAFRFLNDLNKNICNVFHRFPLLPQCSEFHAIRGEKWKRNRRFCIFIGITTECVAKRSLIAVYAVVAGIISQIDHLAWFIAQTQCGTGQPKPPDVICRRKTRQLLKYSRAIKRRIHCHTRKVAQCDFF